MLTCDIRAAGTAFQPRDLFWTLPLGTVLGSLLKRAIFSFGFPSLVKEAAETTSSLLCSQVPFQGQATSPKDILLPADLETPAQEIC